MARSFTCRTTMPTAQPHNRTDRRTSSVTLTVSPMFRDVAPKRRATYVGRGTSGRHPRIHPHQIRLERAAATAGTTSRSTLTQAPSIPQHKLYRFWPPDASADWLGVVCRMAYSHAILHKRLARGDAMTTR